MSNNRRRKRGALTGTIGLGLAAVVGAGLLATTGNPASAATLEVDALTDPARAEQIMNDCNNPTASGAVCDWTNVTAEAAPDDFNLISDSQAVSKWVNCSSTNTTTAIEWKMQTSHAWTIGEKTEATFTLGALFEKMKVSASLSEEFKITSTGSFASTTTLVIPPGETGWLVHDSKRAKITGTLVAKIGADDITVRNLSLDAPRFNDAGAIAAHTRKHNGSDTALCKDGAAPAGLVESSDGSDLPLQP
ncbi:hypothetical protein [Streptomyces sp. NBC_01451]|uniref:hypothetical protein n=1 Tax=Streptomyces sp. NBC_01451 TaxID=2903872 RepID=UPI002E326BF7|nr:hypothetical protein [Streptomyces sp. NBC_01451]